MLCVEHTNEVTNMLKTVFAESQKKAIKEWQLSPLGRALANNAQNCFYGQSILAGSTEGFKQDVISDFYDKVLGLTTAANPFMTMREYIGSYVYGYATFQVLCLRSGESRGRIFRLPLHIWRTI